MKLDHHCKECDHLVTEDIICDICGKSCKIQIGSHRDPIVEDGELKLVGPRIPDYNIVNGELVFHGCYGSKYDLQLLQCDMCEECFDKIKNFIESIGGKIRTKDIPFWE